MKKCFVDKFLSLLVWIPVDTLFRAPGSACVAPLHCDWIPGDTLFRAHGSACVAPLHGVWIPGDAPARHHALHHHYQDLQVIIIIIIISHIFVSKLEIMTYNIMILEYSS